MALRAGYYGLKRGIREKLIKLLDVVPAGIGPDNLIASINDVIASIDLLDDTVGWTGKNRLPITITNQTQVDVGLVVNANKSVTLNGTPTGNYSFPLGTVTKFNIGDKFVISGCPEGGSEETYNIYVVCRDSNNTSVLAVPQYGTDVIFTVPSNTVKIDVYARVVNGSPISNKTFYTMIDTPEQHNLSPAYEPYHENVAERLTPKVLLNNADLNNYLSEGNYMGDGNVNTYTNIPVAASSTSFRLIIMPFNVSASRCVQIIIINKEEPAVYMRTNFAGTWQSWYKFSGTEVTPPTTQVSAPDTRENSDQELEPAIKEASEPAELPIEEEPVIVKKTTRKKSTAAADTEKEGE